MKNDEKHMENVARVWYNGIIERRGTVGQAERVCRIRLLFFVSKNDNKNILKQKEEIYVRLF